MKLYMKKCFILQTFVHENCVNTSLLQWSQTNDVLFMYGFPWVQILHQTGPCSCPFVRQKMQPLCLSAPIPQCESCWAAPGTGQSWFSILICSACLQSTYCILGTMIGGRNRRKQLSTLIFTNHQQMLGVWKRVKYIPVTGNDWPVKWERDKLGWWYLYLDWTKQTRAEEQRS